MTPADRDIDGKVQRFWSDGGQDSGAAATIRNKVLATPPTSALVASRCLDVIEVLPTGAWGARIDALRTRVAHMIARLRQIDQLADEDTDPAAVFEILGGDLDDLPIESFDPQALTRSRIGKATRADAALAFLEALGWSALPEHIQAELKTAAGELRDRTLAYPASALFADDRGHGFALGVQAHQGNCTTVQGFNQVDGEMRQQAEAVLNLAYGGGARWAVEWELPYGGSSIGLALYTAALADQGKAAGDPLLAATGRIDAQGRVRPVDGIPEKIRAAISAGFRRVLVPADNEEQARAAAATVEGLQIIPVERVGQLQAVLTGLSGAAPIRQDGIVRYVRKLLPLYDLDLINERSLANGYQLEVADAAGRATITAFSGSRGTVRAGGSGSTVQALNRLIEERLPASRLEPRSPFTTMVAHPARQDRLQTLLVDHGAQPQPAGQYEKWHYRLTDGPSQAHVILYTTGKCVVQAGQAPAHDTACKLVQSALAGLGGLPGSSNGPPSTQAPPTPPHPGPVMPHIGTDEAGKGDYFGPLVCAACYVDEQTAELLGALGVRDSKSLSDGAIRRLAGEIRRLGRIWTVTTIQPARYNELYAEMRREGKNLNTLVAWGHARSIEDLLGRGIRAEYAVIDKFADERYMRQKLLSDTRRSGLRLDLRTKGEADIAVAAASILARDAFVTWLEDRSRRIGFQLPKGASDQVITAARRIVADHGQQALGRIAKLSFKTTNKVLAGASDQQQPTP